MARQPQHKLQKTWQTRIDGAVKSKEEWEKQFRVQMGRDYFEGKQNPGWPDHEWITINKIYSHMQTQLPLLYNVDPYFYVKVKRSYSPNPFDIAMYESRGKVRASYLNYLKMELKLKTTARLGIQDAHFAFGVIKTHFSADRRDNPDAGDPILDDEGHGLLGDNGDPLIEPDTIPINERYHWTRVHDKDFIWDDDAGPLDDKWSWVAERVKMTKDQARRDPTISNSIVDTAPTQDRDADKQSKEARSILDKSKPQGGGKEDDVLILWEIYDLRTKQWLKIIEGAERPAMMPEALPPGVEMHPYSILRFTLRDASPLPITPISQAIDPAKEYNLSRSRILRHRKRFNRKYEANVSMLEDESELAKLEVGDDGTIIRVNAIGAIGPIKDAPLDQASYQEVLLLNNDMVEMFGTSDESRGLATADSATQASLIDKRMEVREGDRLSMVVDWITDAAKKMDQLVQAHITRDEAVKISGPSGEDSWEMVRERDYESIAGEFEYSVNVGSTIPRLPQIERSQWLAFLQLLGSFPHLMTQKRLMKHMAELHHLEDESMLEELFQLGQKILGGQVPMPGGGGSQAGTSEDNPITKILGAALGDQGGIANGGGAPEAAG